jgi:hypothetical protein
MEVETVNVSRIFLASHAFSHLAGAGISLTLIDSLDTIALTASAEQLAAAVNLCISNVTFAVDLNVSVFETIIRGVGGLLSARLLLPIVLGNSSAVQRMGEALLGMALDLGGRLLPAFDTATGIPYGRQPCHCSASCVCCPQQAPTLTQSPGTVNLLHGVPAGETTVSSLAGAGALRVFEVSPWTLMS